MMNMINANFTKQESKALQVASADDTQEKDGQSDDFNALISGLCMTPPDGIKPDPTKKPVEQDANGAEARMANDRAKLGSVKFNDPKNPAFGPRQNCLSRQKPAR